jgi:hypothetical protein
VEEDAATAGGAAGVTDLRGAAPPPSQGAGCGSRGSWLRRDDRYDRGQRQPHDPFHLLTQPQQQEQQRMQQQQQEQEQQEQQEQMPKQRRMQEQQHEEQCLAPKPAVAGVQAAPQATASAPAHNQATSSAGTGARATATADAHRRPAAPVWQPLAHPPPRVAGNSPFWDVLFAVRGLEEALWEAYGSDSWHIKLRKLPDGRRRSKAALHWVGRQLGYRTGIEERRAFATGDWARLVAAFEGGDRRRARRILRAFAAAEHNRRCQRRHKTQA